MRQALILFENNIMLLHESTLIQEIISKRLGLQIISTRQIIVGELKNNSREGKRIKSFLEKDEYLPDELLNELVMEKINQVKGNILISNYPKEASQYHLLKKSFEKAQINIQQIWLLEPQNYRDYLEYKKGRKFSEEEQEKIIAQISHGFDYFRHFMEELGDEHLISTIYLNYPISEEQIEDILNMRGL